MRDHRKPDKGIEVRHQKGCAARVGGRCNCDPSFRAEVYDDRHDKKIRKTFKTRAAAMNWRQDMLVAKRRGSLRAPTALTVSEAAEQFIQDCRSGAALSRKGRRYAPSTIRGYERTLRLHVLPSLGRRRLSDICRSDIQEWTDRLLATGAAGSTIKNAADPLRRIFDRAVKRDLLAVDPTDSVDWPASHRGRDRIASPQEAEALLAALDESDRALWATTLYAGLRRGESRALRWTDIQLDGDPYIEVARRWDDGEGELDGAKTAAGLRRVPIVPELRSILLSHKLASGRRDGDLVFGATAESPFVPSTVRARAIRAWNTAGLRPLALHEARHTFASLMIAAGVNPKALSVYMGHSSVAITFDRYGHLMPNSGDEAAARLQAYLDRDRSRRAGG